MIVKSLSRKSNVGQLLAYIFAKEEKTTSSPVIIKHNLRTKTLEGWAKEFANNETYRIHARSNNILAYHTILSFSIKDKQHISPQKLKAIAKEYISLRGKDSIYIGTAHFDKDHIHLHLVMSGTKYRTGESNRISKASFHALKLSLEQFQQRKFPELKHSLPSHGKAKSHQDIVTPSNRETRKIQAQETVLKAYNKATSLKSFLSFLTSAGYEPYYRSGRLTGVNDPNSIKHRFRTLGITEDQLNGLHQKEQEQANLVELGNIRSKSKALSRESERGFERNRGARET